MLTLWFMVIVLIISYLLLKRLNIIFDSEIYAKIFYTYEKHNGYTVFGIIILV